MGSGAAMLLLCRAGARAWLRSPGCRGLSALAEEAVKPAEKSEPVASGGPQEPVLRRCELPVVAPRRPVQAWVESLRGYEQERVGLTELHPDVFAAAPRLDILHQVAIWQKNFKRISYAKTKTRAEVRGGGRKPWPQKGSGRARHGSIRSPIWRGGGIAHGPRGPTSYYYMLPMKVRVQGLKVALSVKLAQVQPPRPYAGSPRPWVPVGAQSHLPSRRTTCTWWTRWSCRAQSRSTWRSWPATAAGGTPCCWWTCEGQAAGAGAGGARSPVWLTSPPPCREHEDIPPSIVAATSGLKTFNLVPAIGLNVHSMLKHQTLVLTLRTVAFLEDKLLWHDSRYTALYPFRLPYRDFP
uniref:Large ribosomal subunit protein uL4m n=1 Tax=Equus asinus TaxID=9793 RepID=A0A9L0I4L5_EQUAS